MHFFTVCLHNLITLGVCASQWWYYPGGVYVTLVVVCIALVVCTLPCWYVYITLVVYVHYPCSVCVCVCTLPL